MPAVRTTNPRMTQGLRKGLGFSVTTSKFASISLFLTKTDAFKFNKMDDLANPEREKKGFFLGGAGEGGEACQLTILETKYLNNHTWCSHHGSEEMNQTCIREAKGLIPRLA